MNAPPPASKVLWRLYGYLRPYWGMGLLAIFAMALVAASEAAIPAVLKPVLDKGFGTRHPSALWFVPTAIVGLAVLRGLVACGDHAR